MSRKNIAIYSFQTRVIRSFLVLPKNTSTVRTLIEKKITTIRVLITQESARTHLCHLTHYNNHHILHIDTKRTSRFAAIIKLLQPYRTTTLAADPTQFLPSPPWMYTSPNQFLDLPGTSSNTTTPLEMLQQSTLQLISERHQLRWRLYTDGTTTLTHSGIEVLVPTMNYDLMAKLDHGMTSISTAAIREGIRHFSTQGAQDL